MQVEICLKDSGKEYYYKSRPGMDMELVRTFLNGIGGMMEVRGCYVTYLMTCAVGNVLPEMPPQRKKDNCVQIYVVIFPNSEAEDDTNYHVFMSSKGLTDNEVGRWLMGFSELVKEQGTLENLCEFSKQADKLNRKAVAERN